MDLVGIRLAVQVGLLLVELVFLSPSGLCSLSNLFVAMLVVQVQFVPWLAAHTLMVGSSLSEGCCGWSQKQLVMTSIMHLSISTFTFKSK